MSVETHIYMRWENSRKNAFFSLVELNSEATVIDLGCGNGEFTMEIKEKIGCNRIMGVDPLSPHEKETSKSQFPHVRILTWKGLVELAKFVGFRVERAVGSGHIFGRLGELTNKKNCRFITIKVRKMKVVERSVNEK